MSKLSRNQDPGTSAEAASWRDPEVDVGRARRRFGRLLQAGRRRASLVSICPSFFKLLILSTCIESFAFLQWNCVSALAKLVCRQSMRHRTSVPSQPRSCHKRTKN